MKASFQVIFHALINEKSDEDLLFYFKLNLA